MIPPLVPIRELATQIRGVSYSKQDASTMYSPGVVAVLRAGNIQDAEITTDDLVYVPRRCISDEQLLREHDVLIATSSGSLEVVGKAARAMRDLDMAFGAFCKVLRPNDRVEPRYFSYFFQTSDYRRIISGLAEGANINNLRNEHLDGLLIPLPPPTQQRRIADILERADAIRRKRRETIALTGQLLRSTFLEMFGDPVTNPKDWPTKPLGEAIERLDAGWSANGEARLREPSEYGVLKVSAVTSGVFRPEEHKAVSATAIDRDLVTPKAGDLLFSRANTRDLVAATCLVERDEPRLFLPDKIWRVVPRASVTTTAYLRLLLAHDRFRSELTKTATGTSGSMLNVSMDKLRALRAPLPPLDLQEGFSTFVWKTLSAKARHGAAQTATENLFGSLVARAYSGSLVAEC